MANHARGERQRRTEGGSIRLAGFLLVLGSIAAQPALSLHQSDPAYAYVPNAADGTVSAVALPEGEVAWTIPISQPLEARGAEAAHGIAVSPDGRYLYAGDAAARQLVVVDTATREIVSRIPVSHGVHGIDITRDGRYVWVGGGLEDRFWLGAVSVLNTATRRLEAVVSPGLGDASHFALSPDGRELWVASVTTNLLWIVDTERRALKDVVALAPTVDSLPASPEGQQGLIGFNEVALSPDGRIAYAVGPEASVVYAIDTATRRVLGSARAGTRAHGIGVSPSGREVWTANRSGSLTVLEASTLEVLATVPVGDYANHVAFHPSGSFAYVSRREDLAVLDVRRREIVRIVPVGREPHEISLED